VGGPLYGALHWVDAVVVDVTNTSPVGKHSGYKAKVASWSKTDPAWLTREDLQPLQHPSQPQSSIRKLPLDSETWKQDAWQQGREVRGRGWLHCAGYLAV